MKQICTLLFASILCLWTGGIARAQAQNNAAVPAKASLALGSAATIRAAFQQKAQALAANPAARQATLTQSVPGGPALLLRLKSSKQEGTSELFFGEVAAAKNSSFYVKVTGQKLEGEIMLRDQQKYYSFATRADGTVHLEEKDINKIICVGYNDAPGEKPTAGNTAARAAAIPLLESLPGAGAVVYLDFDGQTVTGTRWNTNFTGGAPIVAAPAVLSESDMLAVWKIMREDFRPFNLNVTTNEAVFNSAPVARRMRVIFTPTTYFYPGAGGVAYLNSFISGGTSSGETPCWVFNSGIIGAGEAGSHEVGHTLTLSHDGRTTPSEAYFQGQASWAPIMGVGYYRPVVQWSKGEYPAANNTEDDLLKITTLNGFTYRADDHGNTSATATALSVSGAGVVAASNQGIISTRTDVDVFSFTTSGGTVTLNVAPDPDYPDLDIALTLRNSANAVVASAEPGATLNASISQALAAGTYSLEIDGVQGSLGANSDYASLGVYFISGTVPSNVAPTVSITAPASGASFFAPATINITATAADANGTVSKVEFFSGAVKLGEDLTAPYAYSWTGVTAGAYSLTAKATDNGGATTTSAAVAITVVNNVAPTVSITAPASGASFFAPATINIAATASDADGTVSKVEFFSGATKLGEDLTAPYTYSWVGVTAGAYSLTAKATDNSSNTTTSAAVAITVVNNVAPTVSITAPASGASFFAPATINITATAADADGTVAKVEFYSGATKIGEDLTAPYAYSWAGVPVGSYSLTAKATDSYGDATTSAAVLVSVGVDTNIAPKVALTRPRTGTTFGVPATITFESVAFDADGTIAKVEFYAGGIKVGEDLTPTYGIYSYSWTGVPAGTYSLTARAIDNGGGSSVSAPAVVTVGSPESIAAGAATASPELRVYPNPASAAHLNIGVYSAVEQTLSLSLYNATSQRVVTQHHALSVGDNELRLTIANLPNGLYILKGQKGGEQFTQRVLIAH
ncbi:Ig-like domain-containing protein [Hymenobacter lucidus]|uniref:Ig-like domain-containing protein n=1 Tax=Hymenobacter lucidus TaxID=2880930 RepID=A0ABS8AXH1_9BACT|nr:Ig-like domain-containing protein [Hymenobacter lucidus]MCB2410489.1 Ig-like domain-containing protein [Hymenobacter lucidus]